MNQFGFSGPRSRQHWFRVGAIDVTTTVLVAGLSAVVMVVSAFSLDVVLKLALLPATTVAEVWRYVTWPLADGPEPTYLNTVIAIVVFWYFGSVLEGNLGRRRYAWLIGVCTVGTAVVVTAFGYATGDLGGLAGVAELGVAVVAGFAAAYPGAQFFFGISFWLIAVVLDGIQALNYLANRDWPGLLGFVVVVVLALVMVRSFGLARQSWIPRIPLPGFVTGSTATRDARKQRKAAHLRVVQETDVNDLLDKIAEKGIGSLTPEERRRLDEHSRRSRGGGS